LFGLGLVALVVFFIFFILFFTFSSFDSYRFLSADLLFCGSQFNGLAPFW